MTLKALFGVEKSVGGKKWVERSHDPMQALTFKQKLNLSELLGRLLSSRGQTMETVEDFLNPTLKSLLPDPLHLKDMEIALQKTAEVIQAGEKVGVFGDYDVDGATSSAVLSRYFKALGFDAPVHIPDRLEEGYGPNLAAFQKLREAGAKLIITVDCGTTAFEPLEAAKQDGLDIIVLDHHVGEPKLPEAIAVVNPNRLDEEESPLKTCAAVGLAFVFVVGLNRLLRQRDFFENRPEPDLRVLLDLVALGTVCDVMPLTGVNRAFVKQGLKVLKTRRNVGLKTLCDVSGVQDTPSAYHLGFVLGPRINAGGRVGEASLGSLLLRSDQEDLCLKAAQRLETYNAERKEIEAQVLEKALLQAEAQADQPTFLVHGDSWHPGVIGIVAGRLKEMYHRPTCVVSFDEDGLGKGSGRSVVGFDLGSTIHAARQSDAVVGGGGHAMAAGFSLTKEQIPKFHAFLNEKMQAAEADPLPTLFLDGALSASGVTTELINSLEKLAPYGVGNPSPKFALSHMRLVKSLIVGESHVKCIFRQLDGTTLEGIAFRCVDTPLGDLLLHANSAPIHIAGSLSINSWMGAEKPQIIIEDAAPVEAELEKAV